jgi:hypothetical protein
LKSQIDKPEMEAGTSPLENVDQFLGDTEYLKEHPNFKEEYREVRIALRPFPTSRPPNVFPNCQNAMQVARVLNEMERK